MSELFGFEAAADTRARKEIRQPLARPAHLVPEGSPPLNVRTVDISRGGICVMSDSPLPEGQKCSVAVDVFFNDRQMKIQLQGEVVYSLMKGMDGFRTGIRAEQLNTDGVRYISAFLQ